MKQVVTTVFDAKAETYSPPFTAVSKGAALRSFMDAVADPKSQFYQHPEDYSLFMLGSYDLISAKFELLPSPQVIANAWEMTAKAS